MLHFFFFHISKSPRTLPGTERKTHCRTALESCRAWGIITVLYIHTRCVVHEELGHAPWPTFLRFVVFAFSPPHVYLGWPRPRCLSSATGVGEEQRFTQFEAASPSAAKRLDAPSQHVDKQSIHTRVTAEQCASQREMCAC